MAKNDDILRRLVEEVIPEDRRAFVLGEEEDGNDESSYDDWTRDELKGAAEEAGLDVPKNATKAQLIAALEEDDAKGEE